MNGLRGVLAALGLLLFSIWLPVAVASYLPGWHEASCHWHPRCDQFGLDAARDRISELRAFMQHRAELPTVLWSAKERAHLAEVRRLLDRAAVVALLAAVAFFSAPAALRARVARAVMLAVAACVIVLPFFGTFWRDVFHPLVFNNLDWKNYPQDTSWWVMPRVYFQYTTGFVIGVSVLLCALLRYQAQGRFSARKNGAPGGT